MMVIKLHAIAIFYRMQITFVSTRGQDAQVLINEEEERILWHSAGGDREYYLSGGIRVKIVGPISLDENAIQAAKNKQSACETVVQPAK